MAPWEPATEAEGAMREALRGGDQELYFRILARTELLLPISAEALVGREPMGWGTWTHDGRTHVLAFTSPEAMRECLGDHAGPARKVPYHELAAGWPNLEWWLAVNPGLPVEGYLPAWFVSQLARGDIRLPRRSSDDRPGADRADRVARARATASVPRPAGSAAAGGATTRHAASGDAASAVSGPADRPEGVHPRPLVNGGAGTSLRTAVADGTASATAGATRASATPTDAGGGAGFVPANDVEERLLAAAESGGTDTFLSTLLLARVLLPVPAESRRGALPGQDGFAWSTETTDGDRFVVVFTSRQRMIDHLSEPVTALRLRFVQLIRAWPDDSWSFAVNPGTPVGAKLPGSQVRALASWAAEVGLSDDAAGDAVVEDPEPEAPPVAATPPRRTLPTVMQKTVAPQQVGFYLDRGYDRVSGFVHRAEEVAHLRTPAALYAGLGLGYPGSPFTADADEAYVLRWPAYRPSLYRIPYGGQHESAMRAMEGWVIERPPFRGNGFAPSESGDVIAEFKVDSVRLPHGAELWRVTAAGRDELVARLNADGPIWEREPAGGGAADQVTGRAADRAAVAFAARAPEGAADQPDRDQESGNA